ICIFASAYDVVFQIFHPANPGDPPNYKNLAVFAGSYVLLGLLATIFGFSRYVTVKLARQAIPKKYMPITREDLPKTAYEFVQSELDRVARLTKKAQPLPEESGQPGWGKPGSSLHDTHFKTFMASTPHFIERAAVAHSQDLGRPPNMSISAYVHMLIDQKLITRDIGLEYIEGYEQARFGGTRNEPLPVTISPPHNLNHHHHQLPQQQHQPYLHPHRNQQHSSGRQFRQSSSTANPRHPNLDPSNVSTVAGEGALSQFTRGGSEVIGEDDYIRFMKVLSWILQELGWDDEAQQAYEEECREQERLQQQRQLEAEALERERNRQHGHGGFNGGNEITGYNVNSANNYGHLAQNTTTRSSAYSQGQISQLSSESYCMVDEPDFHPYSNNTRAVGDHDRGQFNVARAGGGTSSNIGNAERPVPRLGNLSTRSLLTMRTMRTASSTRS
ncbi:hypothetical protein BGX34_009233, partial [Mortierella sp. NVP85]